ncbi:hypothetical protein BA768_01275 [Chryseobacterium sp. CBo1]|nr:hypothetical protein BA768_01275 [Chryseobacterium sp. CBo1]
MKYVFMLLLLTLLVNCSQKKTQNLSFNNFDIEVAGEWKKLKLQGVDSDVGGFITENNDTVSFDYGPYSNSLEEDIVIFERKFIKEIIKEHPETDTSKMIIVSDVSKVTQEDFKINKKHYEKISGYNAKIVSPKRSGEGITGVYFDSLGASSLGKIKFTLYGQNLNFKNQKELLNAIRTIKLKK